MKNGCHSRPEYRTVLPVQDGWWIDGKHCDDATRTPRMVAIPFAMTRTCQYTHSDLGQADKGCDGCRWRHE